jgi:hypothetical protein
MVDLAVTTKLVEKRLLLVTCSNMYKQWLISMGAPNLQSKLGGSLMVVIDVPSDLFQEYKAGFERGLIVWISLLLYANFIVRQTLAINEKNLLEIEQWLVPVL